jgi:hypothetical protein
VSAGAMLRRMLFRAEATVIDDTRLFGMRSTELDSSLALRMTS